MNEGTALRAPVALWAPARAMWLLMAVFVAACGALPGREGDEVAVRDQAQKRWDALRAGKVDEAYEFMSPGSRARMSLDRYRFSVPRGFWTAAQVQAVSCQADRCEVTVDVTYRFTPRTREVEGHQKLKEKWIKESGDWWYVFVP